MHLRVQIVHGLPKASQSEMMEIQVEESFKKLISIGGNYIKDLRNICPFLYEAVIDTYLIW